MSKLATRLQKAIVALSGVMEACYQQDPELYEEMKTSRTRLEEILRKEQKQQAD